MKKYYESELRLKFSSIKSTEGHIDLDKEKEAVHLQEPRTTGGKFLSHSVAINPPGYFLKSVPQTITGAGV